MRIDFTASTNDRFMKDVIQLPSYLLDDSVTWIQASLSPEDVFTEDQLESWATENGFIRDGEE